MLNSYLTDTALLLNDPSNQFYSTTTLTTLINRARRWISVTSLQPRVLVSSLSTVAKQETYALTLANSAVAAVPGVAAPYGTIGIAVQQGNYFIALGRKDFPSFQADERILNQTLNNYPDRFSTYNRGQLQVAYMFPVPASINAMQWDIACTPINLFADTDVEALPLPWTEIVPFKAAQLAAITQQRWADAEGFGSQVETMMNEASAAEMPFMRGNWYPAE